MAKFRACVDMDYSAAHTVTSSALRPHFHSGYVIGYLHSGRFRSQINHHQCEEFRPGDMTLLNPGDVHEDFSSKQERDYLTVNIQDCFFTTALEQSKASARNLPCFFRPRIPSDARIRRIFGQLRQELDGASFDRELMIRELVVELASTISEGFATTSVREQGGQFEKRIAALEVRRTIEFLRDTYTQKFNLNQLSHMAGLSKYYLEKVFKRAVGLSPYQYTLQLRVERAKKLLMSTSRSVVEISMELGFFDQSHFSNHFRRFTGVSPSAYRTASH